MLFPDIELWSEDMAAYQNSRPTPNLLPTIIQQSVSEKTNTLCVEEPHRGGKPGLPYHVLNIQ